MAATKFDIKDLSVIVNKFDGFASMLKVDFDALRELFTGIDYDGVEPKAATDDEDAKDSWYDGTVETMTEPKSEFNLSLQVVAVFDDEHFQRIWRQDREWYYTFIAESKLVTTKDKTVLSLELGSIIPSVIKLIKIKKDGTTEDKYSFRDIAHQCFVEVNDAVEKIEDGNIEKQVKRAHCYLQLALLLLSVHDLPRRQCIMNLTQLITNSKIDKEAVKFADSLTDAYTALHPNSEAKDIQTEKVEFPDNANTFETKMKRPRSGEFLVHATYVACSLWLSGSGKAYGTKQARKAAHSHEGITNNMSTIRNLHESLMQCTPAPAQTVVQTRLSEGMLKIFKTETYQQVVNKYLTQSTSTCLHKFMKIKVPSYLYNSVTPQNVPSRSHTMWLAASETNKKSAAVQVMRLVFNTLPNGYKEDILNAGNLMPSSIMIVTENKEASLASLAEIVSMDHVITVSRTNFIVTLVSCRGFGKINIGKSMFALKNTSLHDDASNELPEVREELRIWKRQMKDFMGNKMFDVAFSDVMGNFEAILNKKQPTITGVSNVPVPEKEISKDEVQYVIRIDALQKDQNSEKRMVFCLTVKQGAGAPYIRKLTKDRDMSDAFRRQVNDVIRDEQRDTLGVPSFHYQERVEPQIIAGEYNRMLQVLRDCEVNHAAWKVNAESAKRYRLRLLTGLYNIPCTLVLESMIRIKCTFHHLFNIARVAEIKQ